ncbi:response regulator receiver protein [Richelia sinica FACHB-800]|jgi:two-component system response regulator|uniref:Response regulator receiver protein n=1 Tax=Richelia sinica FACHB-800 TaxID=1357546 RepID=A0A975TD90_9NOST|nr:response regulator [Richelia sinica]MBD2665563.1 response regulator [Richelia sinica FACHB-800]QXE26557.1 response regulator receiver protein [Richelia sinica FACHB-800]
MAAKNTLLLVEDNLDEIELALLAFEQMGLRENIVIARDGVEAINYLFSENLKLEPLPVLILLDLKLPRIDGLEVLRQIRSNARTQFLPVVILTTSNEESDRLQGYSLGCNSYICKPVDYDQFVHVIQQLGMYWLTINSPPPTP